MGLFDHFPYTNFHELNLDWILRALREIEYTMDQFVAINALKYADPIQWNITSQYEKNTIVIDPQTGTAYISVQPVPVGVALNNTDYWTEVFNLGNFIVRAAQNFANTYEADTTTTATVNTPANGWIVWGDVLYRATTNITAGDSYVIGGNIVHFTIEDIIGHLQDLTTTNKNNLVAAINELVSNLAAEITNRTNADTALQNNITAEATARTNADTTLQNNITAEATTRANADTSLQNNINAEASTRASADNALRSSITSLENVVNKKYVLITDSYGNVQDYQFPKALITKLKATNNTNFFYSAIGGSGFCNDTTFLSQLQTLETSAGYDKSTITDIIVVGGVNDGTYSYADIYDAISAFYSYVVNNYPHITVHLGFISRFTTAGTIYDMYDTILRAYRQAALSMPRLTYIEGSEVWLNYNELDSDGLHPTVGGCNYLAWCLGSYLLGGDTQAVAVWDMVYPVTFDVSGITAGATTMTLSRYDGRNINVRTPQILVGLTGMTGSSFASGIKIASTTQTFLNSVDYDIGSIYCVVSMCLIINGAPEWHDVAGRIMVRLDGIYLKCLAPYNLVSNSCTQLAIWQGIYGSIDPINA